MIDILTRVIKEHSHWLRHKEAKLSFLKFSTPSSGTEYNHGKVLLFVFEEGEQMPTLCVKTVRTYAAGGSIRKSFANLKMLHAGVAGTKLQTIFAEPLYLHDTGETIFSIESACAGQSLSSQPEKLDLVLEQYQAWQKHVVQSGLQHGDLTPDNVIVNGDKVSIVDYDYVGTDWPEGFDLFCLIWKSKFGEKETKDYLKRYLPPNPPFALYKEADTRRKENKI